MQWLPIRFLSEIPHDQHVMLDCSHTLWLVLLSYLIAAFGSHISLTISQHASTILKRTIKRVWTLVGGLCLAGGIWTMHFIGMLAFKTSVPVHYDLSATLFSFMVALTASLIAMHYMTLTKPKLIEQLVAAVLIGLGISAMHYTGMDAIRSEAEIYYHGGLFSLSVIIAIAASFAAIRLAHFFRDKHQKKYIWLKKYSASLVMGAAICTMHYTGMNAMHLIGPVSAATELRSADNSMQLVLIVTFLTCLILSLCLTAAWASRKLDEKERDLQKMNALLQQLDQAKASLEQVAHYDALTEQLNRRGFSRVFNATLEEHAVTGRSLAVMFLDVDHFKRINDSLGHGAGDELLRIVAQRIRSSLRERDIVARLGGDEFCVVCSIDNDGLALTLAERLLERMKEPIVIAERQIVMTTSIGISRFPHDGTNAEELIKHADLALYQAKANGRNTIQLFKQHLTQKASHELQVEVDLRQALQQESGLRLLYQPIIDLSTGEMTRLEALIRWQHPRHGLLTPERFIGVAEANGLITELDKWVLQQACRDLEYLSEKGLKTIRISVNCSAYNFTHNLVTGSISTVLKDQSHLASRLEIELTESALISNLRCVNNQLESIRGLGISVAIDDFGTGYSSLTNLRRLTLDVLKIDRSFIKEITVSAQDREVVKAIISMAHALNLKTVAEGVETSAQLDLLHALGCDQVQGYLFSKPQPLLELLTHYQAQSPALGNAYVRL